MNIAYRITIVLTLALMAGTLALHTINFVGDIANTEYEITMIIGPGEQLTYMEHCADPDTGEVQYCDMVLTNNGMLPAYVDVEYIHPAKDQNTWFDRALIGFPVLSILMGVACISISVQILTRKKTQSDN